MRKRLRAWGLRNGHLPTGPLNMITDVAGVKVGHYTLSEDGEGDEKIRTGVTAILPHGDNLFKEKVPASSYIINGFGKSTGLVQTNELGVIEAPIMLTNTFSVPAVTEGTLRTMLANNPEIGNTTGTINIVVGECNDSYLNDIRGLHIRPEHAQEAIAQATSGVFSEGVVGAGTGMACFQYKGGIGSSSRQVEYEGEQFTVGALVLSNFGHRDDLRFLGINPSILMEEEGKSVVEEATNDNVAVKDEVKEDGSIMIVLATDAPLSSRQLNRLAKRAAFGLAWTGSYAAHGSGDIVIAFSTANRIPHTPEATTLTFKKVREDGQLISILFRMAAESVEEAILNSLLMASTTTGRKSRTLEGFPNELVERIVAQSSK